MRITDPSSGRATPRRLTLLLLLCLAAPAWAASPSTQPELVPPPDFPVRIVTLGGALGSEDARLHMDYCRGLGFNAVWVDAEQAGRWDRETAPEGPALDPRFVNWAREGGGRGLRLFLVINPATKSGGSIQLHTVGRPRPHPRFRPPGPPPGRRARFRAFLRIRPSRARVARRRAALRVGRRSRAPRIRGSVAEGNSRARRVCGSPRPSPAPGGCGEKRFHTPRRCWPACPDWTPGSASSGAVRGRYPLGITRPTCRSCARSSVTARSCSRTATRRALGPERLSLALALGPCAGSDPDLRAQLAGYLSVPMAELGARAWPCAPSPSSFAHPDGYDADAELARGHDDSGWKGSSAFDALRIQAMEWGGWVAERNYRSPLRDNPNSAAEALRDPAAVAPWGWVERRYPARMWELGELEDAAFRATREGRWPDAWRWPAPCPWCAISAPPWPPAPRKVSR